MLKIFYGLNVVENFQVPVEVCFCVISDANAFHDDDDDDDDDDDGSTTAKHRIRFEILFDDIVGPFAII